MNSSARSKLTDLAVPGAITLGGGSLIGMSLPLIIQLDTRWVVYLLASVVFLAIFMMVNERSKFLWGALILSLQIAVYLRFMYGHAGSDGITISLTTLMALAALAWFWITKKVANLRDLVWLGPMAAAIIAYFGTALASFAVTSERFVGLTTLMNYAQYYLIFLVTMNYVTDEKRFTKTLDFLGIVLLVQALVYCIQSVLGITFTLTGEVLAAGDVPRPGGTISTRPAAYASFVLPLITICGARFIAEKTNFRNFFYCALPTLLGIVTIILTYTRAAWGSLVIGLTWVTILSYRRKLLSLKKLTIIAAAGVLFAVASAPMIAARFAEAPLGESYAERAALMDMAIEVIKEEPVFGVGPGAYHYTFKNYLTAELRNYWLRTVHNQYLLQAAETGIPGGIAFVFLFLSGLLVALRVSRAPSLPLQIAGIGCSAGIAGLFFEVYWDMWTGASFNTMLWFLFGLMGAGVGITQQSKVSAGAIE